MQQRAEAAFVVLHALRLKGLADTDNIAVSVQLPPAEVACVLEGLAAADLAVRREGRLCGWSLTTAGRARHAEAIAAEAAPVREALHGLYRRFLPINRDLLQVCTDWQVRDGELNDHGDADYDRGVLARLDAVDAAAQPLCAELGDVLGRFRPYGRRLAEARARVHAGDVDWFTKPVIDSYHTIWFELHEDLLSTLGIERSKEESQ